MDLENYLIEELKELRERNKDFYSAPPKKNVLAKFLNWYLADIQDRRDYLAIEEKMGFRRLRKRGILPLKNPIPCNKYASTLKKFTTRIKVRGNGLNSFVNTYDSVADTAEALNSSVVNVIVESSPTGMELVCRFYRES